MAYVYFRNVPWGIIDTKDKNEYTKSIFCHKVGVISAVECSWVNEKKNGKKAELGDYIYRYFIIWFEL